VLAATGGILLLASNVHGSEHLSDLLVGQILWVQPRQLAWTAAIYAVLLALWFGASGRIGRIGFYLIFACAVTVSVQLVGVYLVFATLIVPPLATRTLAARRLPAAWVLGAAGYAFGLVVSTSLDLPTGPVIVWMLAALGVLTHALVPRRASAPSAARTR
jgi:zinc/manganese transport system permease protein